MVQEDNQEIHRKLNAILASTKDVLTLQEAADYMGCSLSHLYKLTSQGKITYYKPQNKLAYIKKSELNDWLCTNRQSSSNEIKSKASSHLKKLTSKRS